MKPEWLIKRKDAARKAGATAVYRGKKDGSLLPQSSRKCEVGAECDGGIHYHHDSYEASQLAVVRPLCAKHHRAWHGSNSATYAPSIYEPPPAPVAPLDPVGKYPLLRPAQAAELLGVTVADLARLRRSRSGPEFMALSPGQRATIRYASSSVLSWALAQPWSPNPTPAGRPAER